MSDDSAIDPVAIEQDNNAAFNKIRSMTDDLRNVEERERGLTSGKSNRSRGTKSTTVQASLTDQLLAKTRE